MSFACIFVPDFPAEAILRAEPELRAQAVAVLEGKPPLQKIFALNEKARRAGMETGMTRAQVEAAAELVLRPRSRLLEGAAHAALLDCAQSFSPVVEDTACDTLLLDLAGLESLFGDTPKIARDLAHRASALGLEANVAVASNPDAAMLAARGFPGVTVLPAGTEAGRLSGLPLDVLFAGLSQDRDSESSRLLDTLERWGLRNLRGLAMLPEIPLAERLGQKGIRLQQLARGAASRTLTPVETPLTFEEAVELEFPIVLLEPLAFLLQRMLDQICARLSSRALSAQELRLRLELQPGCVPDESDAVTGPPPRPKAAAAPEAREPHPVFTRALRLPVPMLDSKVFLKLLQLDLHAHPPGAPIRKIRLAAEPARPRHAQSGLFLPAAPEPEKLELTLARISGIVGEGKVGSAELLDSHRTESFHMQHFAPELPREIRRAAPAAKPGLLRKRVAGRQKPSPSAPNSVSPAQSHDGFSAQSHHGSPVPSHDRSPQKLAGEVPGAVTALRIFRPALQAAVTLRDGKPARVSCPQRKEVEGEIVWQAGPWRSSGDWWQQDGWAREEWDIALQPASEENAAGTGHGHYGAPSEEAHLALYRLVRDLLSGRWFVEGTYD